MATRRLSSLSLLGSRTVHARSLVAVAVAGVAAGTVATIRCQETPPTPHAPPVPTKAAAPVVAVAAPRVSWLRVLRMVRRCLEVLLRVLPVGLQHVLRKFLGDKCGVTRAAWLRSLVATLASLGPVGVKWGQWASTRYDLFSEDLCKALGQLTNDAPAHPYHVSVSQEVLFSRFLRIQIFFLLLNGHTSWQFLLGDRRLLLLLVQQSVD